MRLLIDGHVLLWWLDDDMRRLPSSIAQMLADGSNELFVSSATIWELSIKQSIGKLGIDADLHEHATTQGFVYLPVTGRHAAAVRALPLHHRDPFDRLLVAQAQVEGLTLVTANSAMTAYDVPILPA